MGLYSVLLPPIVLQPIPVVICSAWCWCRRLLLLCYLLLLLLLCRCLLLRYLLLHYLLLRYPLLLSRCSCLDLLLRGGHDGQEGSGWWRQ